MTGSPRPGGTWRRRAGVVAVVVVATVVMTWPFVSYRAFGHAQYLGDMRLVVWALAWDNHAVLEGLPLFRANMFHPAPDSLRYGEHFFGLSLATLPLAAAGVSPVVAHNVVWWLSFPLNALAAYAWVRRYVDDRQAALLGALAFAFSFFVMLHAHAHLQLTWLWGLPGSLLLLERWFDRPTWMRAAAWAAVLTLQVLTSWYLAVIALVANGLPALVLLAWPHADDNGTPAPAPSAPSLPAAGLHAWWRRLGQMTVASLAMAAAIWPFARHYVGLSGASQAAAFSATVSSYLVPPVNTLVGRWWPETPGAPPRWLWGEQTLFSGWTVLALAAVGAWTILRRGRAAGRAWVLPLLTVAGLLLSLGPTPPLPGGTVVAPYAWLSLLPGVGGMRAPARFAVLVTLGLAALAAMGAARLTRAGPRAGRALVAAAVPLMLAEWFVVDFPGGRPEPLPIPGIYASDEVRSARALLSLPDYYGTPEWYLDADYLYYSTAHWRPVVNGFGREAPPGHADLVRIAAAFPASAGTLRDLGVDLVIVHADRYPARALAPIAAADASPRVRLVRREGDAYLYELLP
ncbi:MAG: hypothetical protein R2708_19480 [Vicinamibacterales bacterium]